MKFEERWELLQKDARESRSALFGAIAWAYTDRVDETLYITPEGKLVTLIGFEPYGHRAFLTGAGFIDHPTDEDGVEYPIEWLGYDEHGRYPEDRLVVDVCEEGWVRRSTSLIFPDTPVGYTVLGPPSRLSDALANATGEDVKRGVKVNVDFVRHDEDAPGGIELVSLDLDEALQLKRR